MLEKNNRKIILLYLK